MTFLTINRVLKSLPVLREQYFPTFWCWESRLQSLVSTFVRNLLISDIKYRRQVFTFSDGGEVGLDWASTDHQESQHQPIVLILPGHAGEKKYFFKLETICRNHRVFSVRVCQVPGQCFSHGGQSEVCRLQLQGPGRSRTEEPPDLQRCQHGGSGGDRGVPQ